MNELIASDLMARAWLPESVEARIDIVDGWHERMSFYRRVDGQWMAWTKVIEIPRKVEYVRYGFLFPRFEPVVVPDEAEWTERRRMWRDIGLRAITQTTTGPRSS